MFSQTTYFIQNSMTNSGQFLFMKIQFHMRMWTYYMDLGQLTQNDFLGITWQQFVRFSQKTLILIKTL